MEAIHRDRCKFMLETFVFSGHVPILINGTVAHEVTRISSKHKYLKHSGPIFVNGSYQQKVVSKTSAGCHVVTK